MDIQKVLCQVNGVKSSGKQFSAFCPAHEDKHRSLSIKEVDGKILIHCFAGCTFKEIVEATGLSPKDFFEERGNVY